MSLAHTPAYTTSHPDRFEDEITGRGYEVLPDTDAEDPRSWNEPAHAALWAYNKPRVGGGSVAGVKPDGNVAVDAFAHYYERDGDDEIALRMTRRYLAAFHPDAHLDVATSTIRGYSQGDWLDVVVAVADGYGSPASHADTFRQWAFGDVWFVSSDHGESMGGIFADDPAQAVAQFRAQHEPKHFVRTLTLVVDAPTASQADDIAESIVSAIHGSDALPTGVRAAVTQPVQED